MECNTCKDLLWDYCDGNLNNDLMRQVDEHLATCPACRQELAAQLTTIRFLKHMPVLTVDNTFVQTTMSKIALVETDGAFLKPLFSISLVLASLLFAMLVIISPIFISLLWLTGNIIFTLVSQGALVMKTVPLIQTITGVVLSALLFIVLAYMRRLAARHVA